MRGPLLLFCSLLACRAPLLAADDPTFDAARAYGYLKAVCDLGPRPSGTAAMAQQQQMIVDHMKARGAEVFLQTFDVGHPRTGKPVRMANIICSWNPEAKTRVFICCHYDTRPFPDRDLRKPRGIFLGANDGASGVALLMEMAHQMPTLETKFGVDFVFFDGEELIYPELYRGGRAPLEAYFLGSRHFATEYKNNPPKFKYACGVLVDMIGDKRLNLFVEANSQKYAPQVVKSVWHVANQMKVREFVYKVKHEVSDDHLPLNEIAKIPTIDIIDFDHNGYWHTTRDVPANCSGASLRKVGLVLLNWCRFVPGIEG